MVKQKEQRKPAIQMAASRHQPEPLASGLLLWGQNQTTLFILLLVFCYLKLNTILLDVALKSFMVRAARFRK